MLSHCLSKDKSNLMRTAALVIITFFALPGAAKPASTLAMPATPVAADGVIAPQLKVVGRLNVNTASRDDLKKVPGLDGVTLEYIVEIRLTEKIVDLDTIPNLSDEARAHLKVLGESNFTRILQNPLQTLTASK